MAVDLGAATVDAAASSHGEVPTISIELMLLRWSESSTGGASVTFALADGADLDRFRALTTAKGGKAGQRFMAALALLGDDEQPVEAPSPRAAATAPATQPAGGGGNQLGDPPGGALARLAGQWCREARFQRWAREVHGRTMAAQWGAQEAASFSPAEFARQTILLLCDVDSRRELDHDEAAEDSFHERVRRPFAAWLELAGGTAGGTAGAR